MHLSSDIATQKHNRTRNALRATLIFFVGAVSALVGEIYLAWQSEAWELFAMAGVGACLVMVSGISIYLVRHNQPRLAIRLLIGASLIAVLIAPLFVSGFGLLLGLGTVFVVLTIASQTLPFREANWLLMLSVGVAMLAGIADLTVDFLGINQRVIEPSLQTLLGILGALMILAYGAFIVYQFKSYPLLTKLLVTFLFVSLTPLALLAFLNDYNSRIVLAENANETLFAAASQTATSIDTFLNANLDNIRTEAQLPVFLEYLALPAEQRPGSPAESEVQEILDALRRRDKLFITSYALLDDSGQNVIDTNVVDINRDESHWDYFQKPFNTGLQYVSPIQFDDTTQAPHLYFSSPIRAGTNQETVGVLRVRYNVGVLQHLIVRNNQLVGEGSYAILLDENHIRLAHGRQPALNFKTIVPLEPAQAVALIEAGRLPQQPLAELATNFVDFDTNLRSVTEDSPYFVSPLGSGDSAMNSAALARLKAQSWTVIFVQPQTVFLAPIRQQTRTILFFVIGISIIVVVIAFGTAQHLATPLIHLTDVVSQFSEGNLEARSQIEAEDETGILARNFNSMAEQVGKLLHSLEEHAYELEVEVDERTRAEAALQQHQEKLEEQVAERTQALTRSNQQLQLEIEEHKQTQVKLERAKEIAESANEAKSAFLANITHELRTPLGAIIGYSEMLQEETEEAGYSQLIPDLQKIWTAGDHLLTIINDLLDLSKIEAGKMSIYPEYTDVPTLLDSIMITMSPLIQKKQNIFHIHCADNVKTIYTDPMKVRQILLNLLSNAAKFTDQGVITLRVECQDKLDDEQIIFIVADTGIGMSDEQMVHVFEPFTQADASTTRRYGGTGLGLAISHRFAQIMGGTIVVESELGAGSRFTLSLPATIGDPEAQLEF